MRLLFAGLMTLAAIWILRVPAYAEAEICPTHVSALYAVDGTHRIFGFQLEAPSARTVTGNLAVETDRGWYRIPFVAASLTKTVRHYLTPSNSKPSETTVFASPSIYATFPQPVQIRNHWVEKASATGETGWGNGTPFTCYPTSPGYAQSGVNGSPLDAAGVLMMTAGPLGPPSMVAAKPVAPIETSQCAHPFADARAVTMSAPRYPYAGPMPDGTSMVMVTIMPSGSLAEAVVYQSSGDAAFDTAAVDAAERSTYVPKIVYCRPSIGRYLFRVRFTHR